MVFIHRFGALLNTHLFSIMPFEQSLEFPYVEFGRPDHDAPFRLDHKIELVSWADLQMFPHLLRDCSLTLAR
ncbi:MAG: hypothetical protein ABI024_01935, partial [Vicinamibacterales bacterium]